MSKTIVLKIKAANAHLVDELIKLAQLPPPVPPKPPVPNALGAQNPAGITPSLAGTPWAPNVNRQAYEARNNTYRVAGPQIKRYTPEERQARQARYQSASPEARTKMMDEIRRNSGVQNQAGGWAPYIRANVEGRGITRFLRGAREGILGTWDTLFRGQEVADDRSRMRRYGDAFRDANEDFERKNRLNMMMHGQELDRSKFFGERGLVDSTTQSRAMAASAVGRDADTRRFNEWLKGQQGLAATKQQPNSLRVGGWTTQIPNFPDAPNLFG